LLTSISALKSPQILELSGIGRKEVLEKVGIPVVVDLPGVGENLQEHIFAGVSFGRPTITTVPSLYQADRLVELKDDVDFDTVDLLRDPEHLKKHLALQFGFSLFTYSSTLTMCSEEGKGLFTTG
jgi:choline dehydrogenase-like flavoprotein